MKRIHSRSNQAQVATATKDYPGSPGNEHQLRVTGVFRGLALLPFAWALLASAMSSTLAQDEIRTWTNHTGRTISAELVELEGGTAKLRMANGQKYDVPLDTLSEADQEYARKWKEKAEARAALEGMDTELGMATEAIVQSPFDEDTPRTRKGGSIGGWSAGIGEWRIEEGSLVGDELPEDNHASSLTYRLEETTHLIITAQVQLGEAAELAFACRDTVPPNLHLGRLYITPEKIWIQKMEGISKTTKAERLVTVEVDLDRDEWYDVTIEIIGDRYRAKVGKEEIEATHPRFADPKGIVALVNKGQGARFRKVALWHAKPGD